MLATNLRPMGRVAYGGRSVEPFSLNRRSRGALACGSAWHDATRFDNLYLFRAVRQAGVGNF